MARSSSSRTPLLAVVALAIGLAAAYLSDCAGFGLGSGAGTASSDNDAKTESTPDPERETPPPEADAKVGAAERVVVVEGAQCRLGTAPLGSCDAVCQTLVEVPGPVTLDGIAGSHRVVDTLRQCLEDGKVDVRMKSP